MSAQNLEIVRILFGHWGTREMGRSFELLHDDLEMEHDSGLPGFATHFRGHEEVRAFWREWLSAWDEVVVDAYELEPRGDQVLATWTQSMRGRGGDVAVERVRQGAIFTLRDGKVARMIFFNGADAARDAFGR